MFKESGGRPSRTIISRPKASKKTGSVNFSIVVATKDRAEVLPGLVLSLSRQRINPKHFEILIIDNGSRDQTAAEVCRLCNKFSRLQIRYSFLPLANASLARNEGAAQAKGKYLAFLDDDCRVPPDWLQKAKQRFVRTGIRVLGGPALVPNRKSYPRWFRGAWEDLKHPLIQGPLGKNQYLFEGNLLVRKQDYLALGGMKTELGPSSRRFAFHEGTELQNRIRKKWPHRNTIFYDSSLAVDHLIQPGKVRLKSRWKRMYLAGLDHPRAHANQEMRFRPLETPFLALRMIWRSGRTLVSFLRATVQGHRRWREYAYNRTGREIYRLGEICGDLAMALGLHDQSATGFPVRTTMRSRIRRPILRAIRNFQRKFSLGSMPLAIIPSTPAWLRAGGAGSGKILWQKAGEVNTLQPSQGSGTRGHPLLMQQAIFQQPKIWLARLSSASVFGPSVAVIASDRTFLGDVSIEWSKDPEDHGIMRKFRLPPPKDLPGTSVLLASTGGNTFHHWMVDVIPRLQILKQGGGSQPDYFLVNGVSESFQRESLELCKIPIEKCITLEKYASVRCETLLLPSLPCASGHPSRAVGKFLREKLLPASCTQPVKTKNKIFVGRTDTQSRQATHWQSIRELLLEEGFEEIVPSQMSLRKQAEAFHAASCVVGIHGAALTNLVFCRPGTKVIELFGWNYVNPCYRDLCCVNHLEHYGVVGRGAGEGPEVVFELHDASGPIHVEPGQVAQALKEAGFRR